MKKKILFIIIILFCFVCTGCEGDVTRHIRQTGYSINEKKFVCSTLLPEKKKWFSQEDEKATTEKIKFMDGVSAISENGNIYELSFGGVYSNNMNCRKVGSKIKVVSMIDNEVVRDKNGVYYYFGSDDPAVRYSEIPKDDSKLEMYKLILGDKNVVKAMLVNSNINTYYVLKTNGNIYNYVIKQDDQTKKYKILTDNIEYRGSNFDGNIVDFKYYGEASSTYFRTTKSIYRMKGTNLDECSKYVDVECKYEMVKDEGLTENMDRIIGYGGSVLITDYGKIFTVGS